jgi:hypothetical protein
VFEQASEKLPEELLKIGQIGQRRGVEFIAAAKDKAGPASGPG